MNAPQQNPEPIKTLGRWYVKRLIIGAITFVLLLVGIKLVMEIASISRRLHHTTSAENDYPAPNAAFKGDSVLLQQSVVVPTLDTPMPPGKNVIWCASFQAAWDRLKDDVVHEPVAVAGAEEITSRLNAGAIVPGDLPEESCYAAAGFAKDGIADRIRKEMKERFQREPIDLSGSDSAILAYGYLQARVGFTIPYMENNNLFMFTDSKGHQTAVSSFGITETNHEYRDLHKQAKVLFYDFNYPMNSEFAVDLCRGSQPDQIVIASVPPKKNLLTTLQYVEAKSSDMQWDAGTLIVPNLNWSINHRFNELAGTDKLIKNPGFEGLYLADAIQTIDFRLDRNGAELKSQALLEMKSAMLDMYCNRPFLIYVKKRDARRPFFVMWVDNAELLSKP
jgi:hypothetical protein